MNWYTRKLSCWRCWNQRIALAKKQWVNSWALCLGELIQKKWEHVQLWAVSKRFCSSEGAKGMLARQLTRCLRARSLCWCLRAGIAYADAYAGLRTPGFCLREVRIATLLLEMKQGVLDVAQLMVVDKANGFSRPWCLRFLPRTTHSAREFSHRAAILITITISIL